ncbi:DUF4376 domain-containing protein [Comamonas antarctica]|uniref:DUF4376 domain-containing protein n=1 Tax=Comamonas antarctica TaxID=2743470 RepID=A0A6N1WYU5_9BURK|nr:DUF4376 domain-containing protein [Comamonas antarctica]QKV52384.1 DUF4376 domain-containing protein [Comamonas antarctica]
MTNSTTETPAADAADIEQAPQQAAPEFKVVPQLNMAGFFLGATRAYASPLEPGFYPLPSLALDAPLPRALGPLECARYNPEGEPADPWDYLPDYSAATVYDTTTGERIGVPPGSTLADVGGTLQAPEEVTSTPQAATLADLQGELLRAAAAHRWAVETGSIVVAGVRVATAIEDQNRITSVVANATLAGVESVDFKAASGWVSLSIAQLTDIAGAIARHVQRCYTAERAHADAIDALKSLEEARAYDITSGWPSAEAAATTQTTTTQQESQP